MGSQTSVKLGIRLSQLQSMLKQPYSIIWDCCCDHGLLGMSLIYQRLATKVVFVDILAHQMAQLEKELQQRFPQNDCSWQVLCEDVKAIEVPQVASQLFIIAGVGGDKTVEFIDSLSAAMHGLPFDLLICSVQGNYSVRKALIQHGFSLKEERIIFENKRFYEAIYVTNQSGVALSATGSSMWNWSDPRHHEYCQKILGHYQKKALADPQQYRAIAAKYELLAEKSRMVARGVNICC